MHWVVQETHMLSPDIPPCARDPGGTKETHAYFAVVLITPPPPHPPPSYHRYVLLLHLSSGLSSLYVAGETPLTELEGGGAGTEDDRKKRGTLQI
jgi:hypothetical protein